MCFILIYKWVSQDWQNCYCWSKGNTQRPVSFIDLRTVSIHLNTLVCWCNAPLKLVCTQPLNMKKESQRCTLLLHHTSLLTLHAHHHSWSSFLHEYWLCYLIPTKHNNANRAFMTLRGIHLTSTRLNKEQLSEEVNPCELYQKRQHLTLFLLVSSSPLPLSTFMLYKLLLLCMLAHTCNTV